MPRRILIVDDSAYVRRSMRALFAGQRDFEICGEATDGQDGIEKAEKLNPDLIILDLSMPVMNGLDAARALRLTRPAIPIILYSLYSDEAVQAEAIAAGIRAVVSKADMDDLIDIAIAIFKDEGRSKASSQES
jgi:DNA-binding NarL/FixJ family response regulator